MTRSAFLEDFAQAHAAQTRSGEDTDAGRHKAIEREAFDEGYKCGWNDGAASKETRELELREELSSALQELNFTYFEAREHALSSIRPVLQAMVDAILPKLATESLGARIAELMTQEASNISPSTTILCAPDSEAMLRELVAEHLKFPIDVVPEPTLTTAQAMLRLDDSQLRVDLDETISTIKTSIDEFYSHSQAKEASNA